MSADAPRPIDEVERDRQQLIDQFVADHGADWAERYRPGSFGCHELLDRAALVVDLLYDKLLTSPACVQNEEWFRLAQRAIDAVHELYQSVGAAHFAEDGEDTG